MVTCKVCAMFVFVPENNIACTCSKCRLVAWLEENVCELEQQVATFKATYGKLYNEVYTDRPLEQQQQIMGALEVEERTKESRRRSLARIE